MYDLKAQSLQRVAAVAVLLLCVLAWCIRI